MKKLNSYRDDNYAGSSVDNKGYATGAWIIGGGGSYYDDFLWEGLKGTERFFQECFNEY